MDDCVFCKITAGQIPCYKVHEDDLFLGFLDIQPLNPGHVILIPKTHYRWTYDVPEFGQFWEIAKKIAQAQVKSLNPYYISFLTMGMLISHAHIHIIPRYQNDKHHHGIDTRLRDNPISEELSQIANKIKTAF